MVLYQISVYQPHDMISVFLFIVALLAGRANFPSPTLSVLHYIIASAGWLRGLFVDCGHFVRSVSFLRKLLSRPKGRVVL